MDGILLVARLVLAGVFVVAGIAKLLDLAGSRQAMAAFGIPTHFASLVGLALPIAEIVLAAALIPVASAWWAALGVLALLLAFIAAIGYNLAQGQTPDCHCFGQLHSAPAGPATLARNGLLAGLALLVVATGFDDPGSSAVAWFGDLSGFERTAVVAIIIAFAALAALGWLIQQILLQNGRLLTRLDEIEASVAAAGTADHGGGRPAPAFDLPTLNGERMSLEALRGRGKPVLLIFSDPNCHACNLLLPDIARWEELGSLTVVLISRGTAEANRAKLAGYDLAHVLLQDDREVSQAYDATATPTAVVVRQDGLTSSAPAPGVERIKALVARTMDQAPPTAPTRTPTPVATVGAPAPALALTNFEGDLVSLDSVKGSDTVLLFWNPTCGFCQRMLPDLQAWDANRPAGAPDLVVVSQGSPQANQDLQLQAPVLLGNGSGEGAPFGIHGTPGGVLIDADGRIGSPVALGASAVFALLGQEPMSSRS